MEDKPHFYIWALLNDDGKLASEEECGVGIINGYSFSEIEDIRDEVFSAIESEMYVSNNHYSPPKEALAIIFKVVDMEWVDGQYNEEGRCELTGYWEMYLEFDHYDMDEFELDKLLKDI